MPHKHSVKIYVEDGHYHVYNRGVEKRNIFSDDQDYRVFLHLLKHYLSPKGKPEQHPLDSLTNVTLIRPRPLPKLDKEVKLLAYCLMPNHFHLLIKQKTKSGMPKLLRGLSTTYAMYFNKRHDRVGYLFQGNYKAVLIKKDPYLLHLSRYIHLNPKKMTGHRPGEPPARRGPTPVTKYKYSSYPYYLGKKKASWVKPKFILSYFDTSRGEPHLNKYLSYQEFVEINEEDPKEALGHFSID
jgi:putative transposase